MGSRIGSKPRKVRQAGLASLSLAAALTAIATLGPATALASSVSKSGSTLTYTAAAGESNNLIVTLTSSSYGFEDSGATVAPGAGCTAVNSHRANCAGAGITSISVGTGNLNDLAWNTSATGSTITGGDGNDTLIGGNGADVLISCAGDDSEIGGGGADVLLDGFFNCSGGGNDTYDGGSGADGIFGGAGDDTATYSGRTTSVFVNLDDAANDGGAGEGDNVHMDVENVTGGSGNDGLTGDSDANTLRGEGGNDFLDGDFGADFFDGGAGDDEIEAFDGVIDSVNCGTGSDSGNADFDDVVSPSCEELSFGDPFPFEELPGDFGFPSECFPSDDPGGGDLGGSDGLGGTGGIGASGGFANGGDPEIPPQEGCLSQQALSCSLVRISDRPADLEAGAVQIKVSLPKAAPGICKAKLKLDAPVAKARAQNTRRLTIGSEQLVLRAGHAKRLEIDVNRSGRRLLSSTERLRVRVNVLVRENGELSKVASEVVKVDASRR